MARCAQKRLRRTARSPSPSPSTTAPAVPPLAPPACAPEDRSAIYRPRRPQDTLLHLLLREHLETLLAKVRSKSDDGVGLPWFVERELRAYLDCGILEHGFLRVRCDACGDELLVAFSCKSRSICPSCAARRMSDGAAHLVDRVLPHLPYRQWVTSFPKWLRVHLALDAQLNSRVLQIVLRQIFSWQRRRARALGWPKTRNAAVTFLQRFGSALQLNPHFHSLLPDGVFGPRFANAPGETPAFLPLPAPTDDEVQAILLRIVRKVLRLCEQLELRERTFTEEQLSFAGTIAMATPGSNVDEAPPTRRRSAFHRGFSLHANVFIHANDREALERLCRYGLRPPFALERLSLTQAGAVAYHMKRPLPDGTKTLVLPPLEFLARVASQVPPPRHHLVHYHGLFAPHARDRALIVPAPEATTAPGNTESSPTPAIAESTPPPALAEPASSPSATTSEQRPRRLPWAALLQRVFTVDVFCCERCGGRRRVVAAITSPEGIEGILRHLGLAARAPPLRPARPGPSEQLGLPEPSYDPCADAPGWAE